MSSINQKFGERRILEAFPFPIAYMFAHRVVNCPDAERKVRGIAHTFENSVRYLATLFLAEYAVFPQSDQIVNQLMEKMKRPSVGDFVALLRDGVKRLNDGGHHWFVAEFPGYFKNIQGGTRLSNRLGHQNSIDSLLALRNRLAHYEYDPDWTQLADDYYPVLLEFLNHTAFITNYSLFRFLELQDDGSWSISDLKGHKESRSERLIEGPRKLKPATSDVFLANSKDDEILSLYPFVMIHQCETCEQNPEESRLTEEVFLLNGAQADETHFIGVRHRLRIADSSFRIFREQKNVSVPKIPVAQVSQEILQTNAALITGPFLKTQIRHGVYMPEAYVPRATLDQELENFFSGNSTAFLLLGQSGIGKTNALCNWATRLAVDGATVLLLAGATVEASAVEESILASLGLEGTFSGLLDVLDTSDLGKLILIVDDLSQHPQLSLAIKQLHQFICRHANRRVKVVFSLRTSHFAQILEGLVNTRSDPDGSSFFVPEVYYTTLVQGADGNRKTYQQVLTKIAADSPELEQMYEAYRNLRTPEGSTRAWQFCPVTKFSELSKNVRDLICNPWHLRLVMELYDQREVPPRIFSTDLLQEYCQRLIFLREDTADLAQKLIDMMCEQETVSLVRSDLERNPTLKAAMIDSAYEPSPYNRLLDDRVLIEIPETTTRGLFVTTRYRVQFAFDSVMEFLIANQCLAMAKPDPQAIQLLLTGSRQFLPFAGAVQAIWCVYAQQDNGDLILDCIEQCDDSVLKPLVPTLRQLEAHGHSAYQRVLDAISENIEVKSALILLMLGTGMGIENGVDAQNLVFERLFNWQGKETQAFKFFAGKYLIFGYVLAQQEAEAAAMYNELQRLYSASANTPPDFLRFETQLTPQQKERAYEFAWFAEAYGLRLLAIMTGGKTFIDEILSRLKLEWLSDRLKVDLVSLIDLTARTEAVTATEASMKAAEDSAQAEKDLRVQEGLRAFDNVGLDLTAIIAEQAPKAIKVVESELGFLYDAYKMTSIHAPDERQLIEALIRVYVDDRSGVYPYLPGKVSQATAIIGNNIVIAQGYHRAKDEEKVIEHLCRAEEYACAREVSSTLLQIYDMLFNAAKEFGATETARKYANLYLDSDCYLSLPEEIRETLLNKDPFLLFMDYVQFEPEEADHFRTSLNRIWGISLFLRCGAWLTPDEEDIARQLQDNGGDWEDYLRGRVFNYDQISREQRVLTVIRFTEMFGRRVDPEKGTPEESFRERVTRRLRLMIAASEREPLAGPPAALKREETPVDPIEYSMVLEDLRNNWSTASVNDRLMGAAAAAVFPAFVPLIHLEDDPELCAAVSKEPGSAKALSWVNSLIRCWCADVAKARRGHASLQEYLRTEKNIPFMLNEQPELVLITLAVYLFWFEVKEQLPPAALEALNNLSTSGDNLELIIKRVQEELPSARTSANRIVSDFKVELCDVNRSLLAEFDA